MLEIHKAQLQSRELARSAVPAQKSPRHQQQLMPHKCTPTCQLKIPQRHSQRRTYCLDNTEPPFLRLLVQPKVEQKYKGNRKITCIINLKNITCLSRISLKSYTLQVKSWKNTKLFSWNLNRKFITAPWEHVTLYIFYSCLWKLIKTSSAKTLSYLELIVKYLDSQ